MVGVVDLRSTEDFEQDTLHQEGIGDFLMTVIRVEIFLMSANAEVKRYNFETPPVHSEFKVVPMVFVFFETETTLTDQVGERWKIFRVGFDESNIVVAVIL